MTVLGLFVAAMVAAPALTRAADTAAAPAESAPAKAKKNNPIAFSGKVTAIDTNAMTLTVGKRTFEITPETKITKDGQPATLADAMVGEKSGGAYKKDDGGKLNAMTINLGTKPAAVEKPKKKKAATESTNKVPN